MGVVVSETARGYLFRTEGATEVVEFESIVDIRAIAPRPPDPPAVDVDGYSPQSGGVLPMPEERSWRDARKGFRVGIGGGFGLAPVTAVSYSRYGTYAYSTVYPLLVGQVPLNIGFGLLDLRLTPHLAVILVAPTTVVLTSVDTQLRFNFATKYALGVGLFQSLAISAYETLYFIGPSVTPVCLRLGERGQSELALWVTAFFSSNGAAVTPYVIGSFTHMF